MKKQLKMNHFNNKILRIIFFKSCAFILIAISFLYCPLSFGQQKTLGMTKHLEGSIENGYVLFAPLSSNTTYLIDKCGRKVHSWESNYKPGHSVYILPDGNLLRTGNVGDTFYNSAGKGGIIEKLDWEGNVLWSYKISSDSITQHHDIYPLKNGNILAVCWHGIPRTVALANGRITGTIGGPKLWSERIIEIKPIGTNDAQVVWQWSLWDHIVQAADKTKPNYDSVMKHPELLNLNYAPNKVPDWIHMNSVFYNEGLDQIVLSSHNTSEIWIIDHSTTIAEAASHKGGKYGKGGDFLYRWGNPAAYNKGTATDQKLFHQHNAYWIPKGFKDGGDIMVYNNGLGRTPLYSSVDIITPPTLGAGVYNQNLPYGPSSQKWIYQDSVPTKFYSPVISGANRLPNGNTLICVGVLGKFFEVNEKKSIVWEYFNPVANDGSILSDGESGGSNVFRCTYYSDTFSGFKNRTLTPTDPIEKNSYSYSCITNTGLSIDKENTRQLNRVYPNPTKKTITITLENTKSKIEIYNFIGKSIHYLVKNRTYNELEIDMEELANGIYSILLNGQFLQFVVKE